MVPDAILAPDRATPWIFKTEGPPKRSQHHVPSTLFNQVGESKAPSKASEELCSIAGVAAARLPWKLSEGERSIQRRSFRC
jgi:hypothetical protein